MGTFIHRRRLLIEWGQCDPAGIVFNSRFFQFFDESTWGLFEAALGVPRADLFAAFDIMGIPLVDARSRFLAPVKFGDTLDIESQVSEFRRSSFDVTHRMTIGAELAVEGRETRVWATRDRENPERIKAKP